MYPWQDYSGRLSPLKLAVFVALFLPALWTAFAFGMGWLQPRPFTEAIHQVGLWMLRFLFIALAITPLRQIVQWPRLILVRRMIGVAAFAYGLAHITLYRRRSEIRHRQSGHRDRAADLSDDRFRRAIGLGRARRDLD